MPAGKHNIIIDQGSDFALLFVVKENGVARDLTGYSARAQLRRTKKAVTADATFTCTLPNPAQGEIKMALDFATSTNLEARVYFYDLEIYLSDSGGDTAVSRLLQGTATVTQEVTRS